LRGILHGGDNDSTGTIGGAWFGALYGFKGVPKNHHQEIEDNKKIRFLAEKLF
jgi:ADP-ribosylarginine hydrolase